MSTISKNSLMYWLHKTYTTSEYEAHEAWKARKHEHACKLADIQSDVRVAKVLRTRYCPVLVLEKEGD